MAFSKAFKRELDRLFVRRTHWLRHELGRAGVGKPPQFTRRNVDQGIQNLQEIASNALASWLAKKEFDQHIKHRRNYRVKGRGPADKKHRFEKWFDGRFPTSKGVIYAFWGSHGKCIYIGRTGAHGRRPSAHFEKYWFSPVKRVTVFVVSGRSHLPKLECLAIHRFQPNRNKNRASTKKWTKACPLCTTHKYIEKELRSIFRFR
jgi:hypothetical protein